MNDLNEGSFRYTSRCVDENDNGVYPPINFPYDVFTKTRMLGTSSHSRWNISPLKLCYEAQ